MMKCRFQSSKVKDCVPGSSLWSLTDISWPLPSVHNTSGITGRKSADTFYFTDGIVYTYCGMAPGFDLKAKLSLSESVFSTFLPPPPKIQGIVCNARPASKERIFKLILHYFMFLTSFHLTLLIEINSHSPTSVYLWLALELWSDAKEVPYFLKLKMLFIISYVPLKEKKNVAH